MTTLDHSHQHDHEHEHHHHKDRSKQVMKTAILLCLGVYFIFLIFSGNLTNYINIRFAWLAYLGAGIFLLLGLVSLKSLFSEDDHTHDHEHHDHDHGHISWGILAIVAIPLILAVIVPSRPLGAEAVGSISTAPVGIDSNTAFNQNPLDRNILDWLREFNRSDNMASFNGQEVEVIGFVYREPGFLDNDFMVSRFTLSCCVADAFAIGLPVTFADGSTFPDGEWVKVRGRFEAGQFDSEFIPIIQAEDIEIVEQPSTPYLYP